MGKKWISALIAVCMFFTFTLNAFSQNSGDTATGTLSAKKSQEDAGENDDWVKTSYVDVSSVNKDVEGSHPGDELIRGDRLISSGANLSLYYNEETSILKVVDGRNGYVWSSGQQNESTESMSKKWRNFAHSLVSAEFIRTATMTTQTANPDFELQETEYLANGIEVKVVFEDVACSLVIRITLEEDQLLVEIPNNRITVEDEGMILSKLYVLPFLGASEAGTGSGYLFIPDGSGALIRFGQAMTGTGAYVGRIYGDDDSVSGIGAGNVRESDLPVLEGEQIYLPVYGVAHGSEQNAFFVEVTGGTEYCEVTANPAGNNTNWYWASARFVYNEMYTQMDNTGSGFVMKQEEANPVDVSLCITFLAEEDADYVGMATTYRQTMLEAGELVHEERSDKGISLLLDCLMGESENNGLYTRGIVLTELSDLARWDDILAEYGIENILYSLRGASEGGYSRENLDDYSLWSRIGTEQELEELQEKGLDLIWNKEMLRAFDDQVWKTNLTYAINRNFIEEEYYGYLDDTRYYVGLKKVADIVSESDGVLVPALSVASLSNRLVGNYKNSETYTRLEARERVCELLAELRENQKYLMFQMPNAYGLNYMDAAYDVPTTNSCYLYETDSVPFVQIVLSGIADMYAETNLVVRTGDRDILQMIDYNVYPQFTVTAAESSELTNTNSNSLFLSSFEDLAGDIAAIYQEVSEVLSPVYGAMIIDRRVVEENVAISEYENGWSVVVNYSDKEYTLGQVTVPAESAVSVETELLQGGERK